VESLANNLVLVAVTVASLWWAGGRDRRALAAVRERLELITLLDDDSDLRDQLKREVATRSRMYIEYDGSRRFVVGAMLTLTVGGALVGLWSRYANPDSDVSYGNAAFASGLLGFYMGLCVYLAVTYRDWFRTRAESKRAT